MDPNPYASPRETSQATEPKIERKRVDVSFWIGVATIILLTAMALLLIMAVYCSGTMGSS